MDVGTHMPQLTSHIPTLRVHRIRHQLPGLNVLRFVDVWDVKEVSSLCFHSSAHSCHFILHPPFSLVIIPFPRPARQESEGKWV